MADGTVYVTFLSEAGAAKLRELGIAAAVRGMTLEAAVIAARDAGFLLDVVGAVYEHPAFVLAAPEAFTAEHRRMMADMDHSIREWASKPWPSQEDAFAEYVARTRRVVDDLMAGSREDRIRFLAVYLDRDYEEVEPLVRDVTYEFDDAKGDLCYRVMFRPGVSHVHFAATVNSGSEEEADDGSAADGGAEQG